MITSSIISYHRSWFFSFRQIKLLRHSLTCKIWSIGLFFFLFAPEGGRGEGEKGRGIFSWMHLGGCNQAWRSFHAGNCVTSLIRWRVVNRGQCTRPTFLAGHYNARFTGVGLVCVCSCTQGCAAVHVRALHRKIPGVRIKFSPLCVFLARSKETERFREIVILFISASLYSLYSLSLSPILTYKRGFSQG